MGKDPLDYLGISSATTSTEGKVELATVAEVAAGTSSTLCCTPEGVAALVLTGAADASESVKGVLKLATTALAQAGTDDLTAITPLKFRNGLAAPGAIGGTTAAAGDFTGLTADGTGTVSLVSNAAALFDATGAGIDLTLSSDAGRVIVNGEEAAANAITLLSAAGGIDANAALQISLQTTQSANDAIEIISTAGGIDILASGAAAGEDIDIVATGSSVNISSSENIQDAIVLTASAGGIDILATGAAGEDIDISNTGGSVNISATESIENSINIESTAGGINIFASGAAAGEDIDIVATGSSVNISSTEDVANAIYLRANAGTSETVKIHSDQGTGVASVEVASDVGGVTVSSGLASDDAINLSASAGGVDIDGALQVNIASSENTLDAIRINASAGGIDIDAAGAAGEDITIDNAAGSINVTAAEAIADSIVLSSTNGGIDILAPGAGAGLDIDIVNTGGSVNVSSSEDVATAIVLTASAGGIDIAATGEAGQDIDIVNTGGSIVLSATESALDSIKIESTAGGIDILASGAAAGEDIDIISTGSSVNITSTETVAAAINLTASTGAGGITMTSGTGNITMAGTIENVAAKYVVPTGANYTFAANPVMQTAATTGGAATGATGDVNLMGYPEFTMEQFILGAGQTIISPRMGTAGLNIALDQVDNEGAEYNFGAARLNSPYAFTVNTSAAFQMVCTFDVADVSGCEPLMMGFRKVEANNATITSYTDYACIGLDNVAFAGNAVISTELNSGGTTNTDTTDAWADGAAHAIAVLVSGAGVVTYTVDGSAPSATAAFTFDSGDVVVPFIYFLNGSDVAGDVELTSMKIGFQ